MIGFSKKALRNFFFGKSTATTQADVVDWFVNESDSPDFDKELFTLWNELPESIDADKSHTAYAKFRMSVTRQRSNRAAGKMMSRVKIVMLNVAAMLTIPLIVLSIYLNGQTQKPKSWVEQHVPYGQKMKVVLPDNSQVWLNAGSKIIYPERFNGSIRQVFIVGEAYAEIAKDESKPFYLSVGGVNIKVLGTKFNVKSYQEQTKTEVSLIEGSIALDVAFNGFVKHYNMSPGNYMSFDHNTGEIEAYQFTPSTYSSWSDEKGGLYFRNQTLEEITKDLERKFDIQIVIRDPKLKHERYFASFMNNESLDDIMKYLNMGNSFRYTKKDSVMDIYGINQN